MHLKNIYTMLLVIILTSFNLFASDSFIEPTIRETSLQNQVDVPKEEHEEIKENTEGNLEEKETELKPKVETINLVSVGDIMMHKEQIEGGYDAKTKAYHYEPMFAAVKKYIQEADLAIGNLEVTLSGKDKGYTGYPCFNAPDALAYALKDTGFDIVSTANNHSLDRRYYGVQRTLKVLEEAGLKAIGSFKTKEESEKILIKEVKGTPIAFLAYTYGTNGISFDKGKEFSVNLLNKQKVKNDLAKARSKGAKLICVSIHYGEEYIREPNKYQKDWINFLVSEGVDIILGNHPHVLQPVEIRKASDGKKETVILYSQGNFVSAQRTRYRDASAIFNISLEKNVEADQITIKGVEYIPTWVSLHKINGKYDFRVLPVEESLKLYNKKKDRSITVSDLTKLKRSLQDTTTLLQNKDKRIKIKNI